MNFLKEVEYLSHQYARSGGKKNRKMQRTRMIEFAKFVQKMGCKHAGGMGKRHVILYYKSIANFKESTQYNHWRALCALWKLLGRADEPHRPEVRESDEKSFFEAHRPAIIRHAVKPSGSDPKGAARSAM